MDDEIALIASLYEELRDKYGFYPEGLGDNGNTIIWGIALKSDLQILMEKDGDKYEKRGKEIGEYPGEFGRIMESRGMEE